MSTDHEVTLIFDIGGVVVDWDPRHLFDRLLTAPDRDVFLTEVCTPSWNAAMDRGRRFADAVAELSERRPEWAPFIRAYSERWADMLGGLVPGAADLLADLARAGCELFAITNWSAETYPIARATYPELAVFDDRAVVSGDVGTTKPDARIYELALERFGLERSRCLFIDDSPANVEGARAVGLPAVHFRSVEALRRDPALARFALSSASPH